MKSKTKSRVKVIMLLFTALLMFNCQNDENLPDQLQNKIETVTIDEAENFLMHSINNSSAKSTSNEFENLEFNKIVQEKINGSDQLLTVIPFVANNDHENNRILMLKIDNEIKSVVFSMYADENSAKENFSGKLFAYSLNGNFISGFRAKNGIIVSQFFENNSNIKTNTENGKITTLTRKTPSSSLNEVFVQNNYRNTVHALDMFGYSSIFGNNIFGGGFNDYGGVDYYSWDAGGGDFSSYEATINIIASGPKIDPAKENKCFDLNKPAELTIYIQQGKEGTRELVGPNEVGHVFIGIKQNGIERHYGFYPQSGANTAMVAIGKDYNSELRDNSKELYHVSISKSVSADQLSSIIKYANKPPSTYNVNSYACTDFGIAIGKLGGINLPATKASSLTFSGTSPGNLGEDVRSGNFTNTTKTLTKNNAPQRKGECN